MFGQLRAWFSNDVPQNHKDSWQSNGGLIEKSPYNAYFLFVNDTASVEAYEQICTNDSHYEGISVIGSLYVEECIRECELIEATQYVINRSDVESVSNREKYLKNKQIYLEEQKKRQQRILERKRLQELEQQKRIESDIETQNQKKREQESKNNKQILLKSLKNGNSRVENIDSYISSLNGAGLSSNSFRELNFKDYDYELKEKEVSSNLDKYERNLLESKNPHIDIDNVDIDSSGKKVNSKGNNNNNKKINNSNNYVQIDDDEVHTINKHYNSNNNNKKRKESDNILAINSIMYHPANKNQKIVPLPTTPKSSIPSAASSTSTSTITTPKKKNNSAYDYDSCDNYIKSPTGPKSDEHYANGAWALDSPKIPSSSGIVKLPPLNSNNIDDKDQEDFLENYISPIKPNNYKINSNIINSINNNNSNGNSNKIINNNDSNNYNISNKIKKEESIKDNNNNNSISTENNKSQPLELINIDDDD